MLTTALILADKNIHVFPCLPRDKRPATQHGCLDATTDPEIIRAWWRERPDYNLAIATGVVSKLFVVDIDGVDAEVELTKLERTYDKLPQTVEAITARGRHLYFQMPDVPVRNSAGKIAAGVDVRGTGGFVISPPSVHPSGRAYAWSVDCASALAAAPGWLLDKITEHPSGNGQQVATPPCEWRALITDGVPEGRRDVTLARVTGYLLRHHIDPVFAAELVRLLNAARCLPPLPDEDVERIVNSIAGKELKRRQHG